MVPRQDWIMVVMPSVSLTAIRWEAAKHDVHSICHRPCLCNRDEPLGPLHDTSRSNCQCRSFQCSAPGDGLRIPESGCVCQMGVALPLALEFQGFKKMNTATLNARSPAKERTMHRLGLHRPPNKPEALQNSPGTFLPRPQGPIPHFFRLVRAPARDHHECNSASELIIRNYKIIGLTYRRLYFCQDATRHDGVGFKHKHKHDQFLSTLFTVFHFGKPSELPIRVCRGTDNCLTCLRVLSSTANSDERGASR
ncbi:hypothetical protein BJV77DRAFT_538902 [Russula vinacea]|nr:hypothetical protein BJV77DRAFT_538902 [Russula vinacea]